jgi:hypothetical protein
MQKAKNPKQEDDWNWNSDHPKQYAFTHWSSPIFKLKKAATRTEVPWGLDAPTDTAVMWNSPADGAAN